MGRELGGNHLGIGERLEKFPALSASLKIVLSPEINLSFVIRGVPGQVFRQRGS
jgi:hypothetical protein